MRKTWRVSRTCRAGASTPPWVSRYFCPVTPGSCSPGSGFGGEARARSGFWQRAAGTTPPRRGDSRRGYRVTIRAAPGLARRQSAPAPPSPPGNHATTRWPAPTTLAAPCRLRLGAPHGPTPRGWLGRMKNLLSRGLTCQQPRRRPSLPREGCDARDARGNRRTDGARGSLRRETNHGISSARCAATTAAAGRGKRGPRGQSRILEILFTTVADKGLDKGLIRQHSDNMVEHK